ncbi:MAG TPA: hypothetical protein VGX78_05095 [Pirellulales bacterium]|nr:hypothetical protein [Pirellulales bacterium]
MSDVEFSGDGASLFCWTGGHRFLAIDVKTGEQLQLEPPPKGIYIRFYAYSPHGSMLASGCTVTKVEANGGFQNLPQLEVCHAGTKEVLLSTFVRDTVTALAFSPDGATLVAGLVGGPFLIWDTKQWQQSVVERAADAPKVHQYEKIVVSADSDWLAVVAMAPLDQRGQQFGEIWTLRSKQSRTMGKGEVPVDFTPNGTLIVPSGGRLTFIYPATGEPLTLSRALRK